VLFVVSLAAPPLGYAASVRVPADYFGVNFNNINKVPASSVNAHLTAIRNTGVTQVRLPIGWNNIEPKPPDSTGHHYVWATVDQDVLWLAQHGLRAQAMFAYAPPWASSATAAEQLKCREQGAVGLAPGSTVNYAAAAKALVERYGPGGTFWANHPGLAAQPIRLWEIWNSENTAGTWCPQAEPGTYAVMFMRAFNAIRSVDPNAEVIIGGLGIGAKTQNGSIATADYLDRVAAAQPSILDAASAVGLHIYPGTNLATQLNGVATMRGWVRGAGFPDSTPLLVNEVGFTRVGGSGWAETQDQRVQSYRNVMTGLPRTNCNVSGVLQYTWTTREQNLSNPEDFFGIANWGTAALEPPAVEFGHDVALMRGQLSEEPPTQTIMLCPGMPLPDTDGDGVPDEDDYYPLDPSRSVAPGGGSTGTGGSTGDGSTSGGSGGSAGDGTTGGDGGSAQASPHRKLRRACRRWYRPTARWRQAAPAEHRSIVRLCVRRALALRQQGELRPLRRQARQSCAYREKRRARRLCSYAVIRKRLRQVRLA